MSATDSFEQFKNYIDQIFDNIPLYRDWIESEQSSRKLYEREIERTQAKLTDMENAKCFTREQINNTRQTLEFYEHLRDRHLPRNRLTPDDRNEYLYRTIGKPFSDRLGIEIDKCCQELFAPFRQDIEAKLVEMKQKYNELKTGEGSRDLRRFQIQTELKKIREKCSILTQVVDDLKKIEVNVPKDIVDALGEFDREQQNLETELLSLKMTSVQMADFRREITKFKAELQPAKINEFVRLKCSQQYELVLKRWFDLGHYIVKRYERLPGRFCDEKVYLYDFTWRSHAKFFMSFDKFGPQPRLSLGTHAKWGLSRDDFYDRQTKSEFVTRTVKWD